MRIFILSIVLFVFGGCFSTGIVGYPDSLGLDIVEVELIKPEVWTLKNGLRVYYLQDNELPLIEGVLFAFGGSLWEPETLAGLASATGSQMREGGIHNFLPDKLDELLDSIGASIESSIGTDFATVTFSTLEEDFDRVFPLFRDVIINPTFDSSRLSLWKRSQIDSINQRSESASTMAQMGLSMLVYGDASPYSRVPSEQTINRITPGAMKDFHKRIFNPSNSILVLTGNISSDSAKNAIEKNFLSWKQTSSKKTITSDDYPPISHDAVPGIYVLERDFEQAQVSLGHIGPPRLTEDRIAISIFNRVYLSSGFSSLLFSEIRGRLGLAYYVGGGIYPGAEMVSCKLILVQEMNKLLTR
jgi:zinc protease